jgi:hypothetical protein
MRIRQLVFAARRLRDGSDRLDELLRLDEPFRDRAVEEFGLDNAVFVFGRQFLEIVSPVQEGTTAGRLLDRRGDTGYMVILQVASLAHERARLASMGVRTVWQTERPDISAMHLHPKDVGGAIVSLDEARPPESWRWGGPHWRLQPGRRARQRIVAVAIEAIDPAATARRWSSVFGLAAPLIADDRWRVSLHEGWVDFVHAGERGEGLCGCTLEVADRPAVIETARALGLPVDGHVVTLFGMRLELRVA